VPGSIRGFSDVGYPGESGGKRGLATLVQTEGSTYRKPGTRGKGQAVWRQIRSSRTKGSGREKIKKKRGESARPRGKRKGRGVSSLLFLKGGKGKQKRKDFFPAPPGYLKRGRGKILKGGNGRLPSLCDRRGGKKKRRRKKKRGAGYYPHPSVLEKKRGGERRKEQECDCSGS